MDFVEGRNAGAQGVIPVLTGCAPRLPFLRCFKTLTVAIVGLCEEQLQQTGPKTYDPGKRHHRFTFDPRRKRGPQACNTEAGGVPDFLASRRQSFSKGMKKFNKKHCNNRYGK
jgi:hypothetical protein